MTYVVTCFFIGKIIKNTEINKINLEINNIIVSVGFEDAVLKELMLKGYNDENTNVVFSFGDGVLSNAKINSYLDSQVGVGFVFGLE